jgi:hypothetical protein
MICAMQKHLLALSKHAERHGSVQQQCCACSLLLVRRKTSCDTALRRMLCYQRVLCTCSLHRIVLECAGPGALTPSGPVRGPMGGVPQQGGHYNQNQPQQPYGQQQHRPQQPGQQHQHHQQQQGQYGQQPEEGGGWTGGIKNLFGKVFVVCCCDCTRAQRAHTV